MGRLRLSSCLKGKKAKPQAAKTGTQSFVYK